jgi:hypothetical protein
MSYGDIQSGHACASLNEPDSKCLAAVSQSIHSDRFVAGKMEGVVMSSSRHDVF